jgi:hypothetical protein|tara:strand:+ start:117 stop:716 length:600 start_codon:yes stop_codon:yes gene_type:complete
MAVRGKITINQVTKKAFSNSKVFQNLAYGAAKKKAAGLRSTALKELNTHVVTQEIEKGPSSGGSRLLGGRGNFFGFLGFNERDQPVTIIRETFQNSIKVRNKTGKLKKLSATSFSWDFIIDIPSSADIYKSTRILEWTSGSWVRGVEKGITNASKTIFLNSDTSRSGVALQTTRDIGFIKFSRTPYITEILNKLQKGLS